MYGNVYASTSLADRMSSHQRLQFEALGSGKGEDGSNSRIMFESHDFTALIETQISLN